MRQTVSAGLLLGLWMLAGDQACAQFTDPAAGLALALKARAFESRYEAAVLLGALGPKAKAAVPNLVEVLRNDEVGEVRFEAAKALGQIGAREALPALQEALKDPDHLVRVFVAEALVKIDPDQDKAAVAALVECLRFSRSDPAEVPPHFVYNVLYGLGPKARGAEEVVMEDLKGSDLMIRTTALHTLNAMQSDNPALVPLLIAILEDRNFGVLAGAAKSGGNGLLLPLLVGRLTHAEEELSNAFIELSNLRILTHVSRREVAALLGKIGPKAAAAVPALEAATQDADPQVRKAAQAALKQVRRKP